MTHQTPPGSDPARPSALVNPASGLANDYLNVFNEILMLIEQLPGMPELMSDIIAWHPIGYTDYFTASNLPDKQRALEAYASIDEQFRASFEAVVAELDHKSVGAVAALRRLYRSDGSADPDLLELTCLRAGDKLRKTLMKAATLVNHGTRRARETAQHKVDRLFADPREPRHASHF